MGEKRAYKSRKPGGGRKKLKPEYDAEKNLKEQMDGDDNYMFCAARVNDLFITNNE